MTITIPSRFQASTLEGSSRSHTSLSKSHPALVRSSCADNRLDLPPNHTISNTTDYTLIGKVVALQSFNSNLVHEVVSKAWNLKGPLKVVSAGKNLFVFSFEQESNLHHAYSRRPWTLKGAHLLLKDWKPYLTLDEIDFTTSTFWVQVHGLPSAWQFEDNLRRIGMAVSIVKTVDFVKGVRPS